MTHGRKRERRKCIRAQCQDVRHLGPGEERVDHMGWNVQSRLDLPNVDQSPPSVWKRWRTVAIPRGPGGNQKIAWNMPSHTCTPPVCRMCGSECCKGTTVYMRVTRARRVIVLGSQRKMILSEPEWEYF